MTKPKPLQPPRVKRLDLTGYRTLIETVQAVEDLAHKAKHDALLVMDTAQTIVTDAEARVLSHVNREDLRPKLAYRQKGQHVTLALNDVIYRYGPKRHLDELDETPWEWQRSADGQVTDRGQARNMHACLFAVLQDFCNEGIEPDDAPAPMEEPSV